MLIRLGKTKDLTIPIKQHHLSVTLLNTTYPQVAFTKWLFLLNGFNYLFTLVYDVDWNKQKKYNYLYTITLYINIHLLNKGYSLSLNFIWK